MYENMKIYKKIDELEKIISLNKEGFNSIEDYMEFHSKNKLSEKTILLKGSRGIALELLIPHL